MPNKGSKKKIFDWALLRRVFGYTRPYRKALWITLMLAILLSILAPLRPYFIQKTVNVFIREKDAFWLLWITVIQVGLLMIETVFRFIFSFRTAWMGQHVVKDLRVQVFEHILGLNLRQYDKTPIGTLTTRTINDIESINDIFADGLIPIIADLLSIISILSFMFFVDWRLTLICLIPFPILLFATYFFKESVNRSFIRVRNAVASLNAFVQEHITGMQVVQAFAAEEKESDKFRKINQEHRNANIRAIFAYSVFFPVVEIILALSTGLLVWWASRQALQLTVEESALLTGKMIAFILYLNLLFRPLRVIADKFNVLQMGMVASERVFKVLDNEDSMVNEGSYQPGKLSGQVEFENVWYAYDEENWVLKNVSFQIPPGKSLAIVGHTGSGKSTIISLLNRLYEPAKGQIKVDGLPLPEYELSYIRGKIGYVLQDVFLFSGSIFENVTLRNPEISREQVVHAAKLIGIHDFIIQLPGDYDYNVMERGATLSLGQRQLLSFLRALLFDPAILVLDEATSSVDSESEALIKHAIETLIAGRTSIIIAHRLSTIRKADSILLLDKGVVQEWGNHEDLLARKGPYYKLYQMQFGHRGQVPV
jgi:ATP-binding cassette, subfamily B, multidrug efflux pump